MASMWMVRAERNGRLFDDFKEKSVVAIGWHEIGSLDRMKSRRDIAKRVQERWPELSSQSAGMAAGQIDRFRNQIQQGDRVVTYDPGRRVYLIGTIAGPYRSADIVNPEYPNVLPVEWEATEVSRDLLSVASKNSLGAISTLFLVPSHAQQDLERALRSGEPAHIDIGPEPEFGDGNGDLDEGTLIDDVQARATEFIKDRINKLDWAEMQELVAGLLRAMGYKALVSPPGPDRGKDIVASPDGFGFESPRIVVEVKHRGGAMGASDIRSFLGGRHPSDKGLYVSTGGFSKDARYESDRANIPIHLMDLDALVEAVIDNYDALDNETRQLLPLKRVYWPI